MEKTKMIKNKALGLLARLNDNNLGMASMLLRGLKVSEGVAIANFLREKLPNLYLTVHHAKGHQIHPRMRGWSEKPQVSSTTGHPDWGTQKEIALFEVYIGKPREYWSYWGTEEGKEFVELPIETRIREDMKYLEDKLLGGLPSENIEPREGAEWSHGNYRGVWAVDGTRIYKLK